MSVTILRVGRDASGWAMRDPSDCLTAGITSKLILISSGIGAASATFRKQVPGPPVSVYSGYLYVETDDPYGTYLSESDFGYFTPLFRNQITVSSPQVECLPEIIITVWPES